jgi:hypothetical protein
LSLAVIHAPFDSSPPRSTRTSEVRQSQQQHTRVRRDLTFPARTLRTLTVSAVALRRNQQRRTTYPGASHRSCTLIKWKQAGLYVHWMVTARQPHLTTVRSWNNIGIAASQGQGSCQRTPDWQRADGFGLFADNQRLCDVAPITRISVTR